MQLEEKIARLKRQFGPEDLRVPFTDAKEILRKIETQFLRHDYFNFPESGWMQRLKGFEQIRLDCIATDFIEDHLDPEQKYWWVFVDPPFHHSSRNKIFDATTKAGLALSSIFRGSPIFIIEKKYAWMWAIEVEEGMLWRR
jgi:hypothetical protein